MIRLAKLPERNPIRIGISITPSLHEALNAYATVYAEQYGVEEPLSELIPAMLASYLEADRAFQKSRAERSGRAAVKPPATASGST
jgi:hypothetical protein